METELGRYYTSNKIGHFLVSQMNTQNAENILDLGCGVKCLSQAASCRWSNAEVITLDIDEIPSNNFLIHNNKHITSDALFYDLPDTLGVSEGAIDIAVCNPPFIRPNWKKDYEDIVASIGIDKYFSIKSCYNSEILFIAQIIRMLKSGGEAGVILPDNIFSAKRFRAMREYLISEHSIKKIIELPSKIFRKTEAKTHILIFNKEKTDDSSSIIELSKLDDIGNLSQPICIKEQNGIERLDYSYHNLKIKKYRYDLKLDSIIKIKRGRLNSKQIKELTIPKIHTTDIKSFCKNYILSGDESLFNLPNKNYIIAEPGDILMSRVGRNFYKKIIIIEKGYAVVSDCLFVIKCKEKYREIIFKYFTSKIGQEHLIALSYGVTAKQISIEMIKNIKLEINND